MKKILFSVIFLLTCTINFAQSAKFETAMKSNLEMLKNAKQPADYLNVAGAFERIALAEKTQWLPYYFAALAQIQSAMTDPKADKDVVGKKVDVLLASADAINKNAELCVLHYFNETLKMLVNPQERWQTNGVAMENYFQQGIALDPNNPRLYFMKAENIMHTPENFGGGKEKAKPIAQKAVDLFATFKPANDISPNWGRDKAEKLLEVCSQ